MSYAYVKPISYHNVTLKVYDNSINLTEIYSLLDSVNSSFYKDLKYIKFHSLKSSVYCGMYWWGNGIDMYCWDREILVHELAHHMQYIKGDYFSDCYNHICRFEEFRKYIFNNH